MTMLKADVKKWIEATQAFEKKDYSNCISILQSANESSKICFTLGMAYYNLNQPKDAYYYFGRSVEFDTFLAVGYYMRGVCALLTGDPDSAYWDFAAALEKLREHEYIDYTQLKMPYRLLRSEILFNLALSLISGGRDAYDVINQARSCQEIHDEQKSDFQSGLQKLQSGQSSGIKPLSIDKSKVFQPPKVNTGGPDSGGSKGSKPPSMKQEEPKSRDDSSGGPPSRSQPVPSRGNRPAPSPASPGSQTFPSSTSPVPARSLPSVPARTLSTSPSPSRAPIKKPSNPLPPAPGRGPGGPGPRGPAPARANAPLPTPPVEMVRVKVYYKDKRLVEIPKDNPVYNDVKSRVELKFGANGLLLKYQMTSGEIKTIKNQNDLNEAVAQGLTDMYVNKPGEVNEFEPKPPNAADEGWQECYTDDGQLYYFNLQTGESSWDPPANWGGASSAYSPTPPKMAKPAKKSDWIECFTDSGDKYYYNTKTDESSWDRPANF